MTRENYLSNEELLSPEKMIMMYARGAFPMADETGEINWYMPDVRTIIPLDSFNTPRSLKKFLSKTDFEFYFDRNTFNVLSECAKRETTWISEELISAYKGLHQLGHLHSVEVYQNEVLVGGLYGITYMGAFFGESMFSKVSQASKCALVKLVERLREKNFILLDVQYQTEHLKMFGAKGISFVEFSDLLLKSHTKNVSFN
ncbi:leucyl/phenylalanyl-tRNA--protein transferase [bacterium]|nr:leucyl/phenylalanyl-tRNA--protein transferase [bacterium]